MECIYQRSYTPLCKVHQVRGPPKYADDSTAYHPIMKTDIEILSSTKQASNISILDDCLQQAADFATEWCNTNSMLINATK